MAIFLLIPDQSLHIISIYLKKNNNSCVSIILVRTAYNFKDFINDFPMSLSKNSETTTVL